MVKLGHRCVYWAVCQVGLFVIDDLEIVDYHRISLLLHLFHDFVSCADLFSVFI